MEKKKTGVAVLISDKTDFKTKAIVRQRRALHNDKKSNPIRGITLANMYAPNIGAPKYVKQILWT